MEVLLSPPPGMNRVKPTLELGNRINWLTSQRSHQYQLIVQDGVYSYEDFVTAFEEFEVQRVIRSYENSISINIHCCHEGNWTQVR